LIIGTNFNPTNNPRLLKDPTILNDSQHFLSNILFSYQYLLSTTTIDQGVRDALLENVSQCYNAGVTESFSDEVLFFE